MGKLILKSDNVDGNYPIYMVNAEEILEAWDVTLFASSQMTEPVDVYDKLQELESKLIDLEERLKKNA